jgi:hypothetical protein
VDLPTPLFPRKAAKVPLPLVSRSRSSSTSFFVSERLYGSSIRLSFPRCWLL